MVHKRVHYYKDTQLIEVLPNARLHASPSLHSGMRRVRTWFFTVRGNNGGQYCFL